MAAPHADRSNAAVPRPRHPHDQSPLSALLTWLAILGVLYLLVKFWVNVLLALLLLFASPLLLELAADAALLFVLAFLWLALSWLASGVAHVAGALSGYAMQFLAWEAAKDAPLADRIGIPAAVILAATSAILALSVLRSSRAALELATAADRQESHRPAIATESP